ncbi:MAG: glycosyltransferase, partial [Candidatus Sericytochromatia bacterium]
QAVAAGLPIVTLPGDRMIGRITAALCKRVGVEDGIVASGEEYIERAVTFANNPALRADIGQRLRAGIPLLYEDESAVACFAEFLERAVVQALA